MPTDQDRILTSRGQLVTYDFSQANLVPSMNGVFMSTVQDWAAEYACPFPGEIVAIGWMYANSYLTAGEVYLQPSITGQSVAAIKADIGRLNGVHVLPRGRFTINADGKLGVRISTTDDLVSAGTTHLSLSVYVVSYVDF